MMSFLWAFVDIVSLQLEKKHLIEILEIYICWDKTYDMKGNIQILNVDRKSSCILAN